MKKSNFIFSDFGILLVCLQYRSKMVKNAKRICVAICFGSSNNLTGLYLSAYRTWPLIGQSSLKGLGLTDNTV